MLYTLNLSLSSSYSTLCISSGSPRRKYDIWVSLPIELDEISQIKGISIVHMNVRSLMNKFSEVKPFLTRSSPDVLLLSETWTQPELPMSLFSVPNYNHWRFDRQTVRDNGLRKQGGGLCIYMSQKNTTFLQKS